MTTWDFIIALFYQVDEQMRDMPKHPDAHLWPSEVGTLGMLHALKGGGNRAFYRWLTRDYRALFPRLPERTRLFRLFKTHQDWTTAFLAAPTVLGVIDTYGIELIHPIREGRSSQQIGRKGLSNHRWIVGGKLCLLLNQWGLVVAWACATANVPDNTFQWLIRQVEEQMIVLSDTAFHATEGDPTHRFSVYIFQYNRRSYQARQSSASGNYRYKSLCIFELAEMISMQYLSIFIISTVVQ